MIAIGNFSNMVELLGIASPPTSLTVLPIDQFQKLATQDFVDSVLTGVLDGMLCIQTLVDTA